MYRRDTPHPRRAQKSNKFRWQEKPVTKPKGISPPSSILPPPVIFKRRRKSLRCPSEPCKPVASASVSYCARRFTYRPASLDQNMLGSLRHREARTTLVIGIGKSPRTKTHRERTWRFMRVRTSSAPAPPPSPPPAPPPQKARRTPRGPRDTRPYKIHNRPVQVANETGFGVCWIRPGPGLKT